MALEKICTIIIQKATSIRYKKNRQTGKTTAKKGPYDQYNAFKEFFDRETEAHIITAWMAFVGLDKMDGKMKI